MASGISGGSQAVNKLRPASAKTTGLDQQQHYSSGGGVWPP
jgi:hypothetical protein